MNLRFLLPMAFCLLLWSCNETPTVDDEGYEVFTIRAGQHSSITRNEAFTGSGINATVVFDESAIYTLEVTSDQADINKLLGFSDCTQHHQSESARIGWRWYEDELQILAYAYLEGQLHFELMGSVPLDTEIDLMIRANGTSYDFSGTGLQSVSLARTSDCEPGENYWLWPYFGGDQVAPHDVTIRLKRDQVD